MGFWDDEQSIAAGVPVELHHFQLLDTAGSWPYADAPADIVYGEYTYYARYIKGEEIEQGSNALKNQTKVLCDWDLPYAAQYLTAPPEGVIDYARYKGHGENFVTTFIGVVVAGRFVRQDR